MIDFSLSEDLQAVVDTAERFAREQLFATRRDAERARDLPAATLALARSIGFGDLGVPQTFGGAGLGALARCLVAEALAAGDPGGALRILRHAIACTALSAFGDAARTALEGVQDAVLVIDLANYIEVSGRAVRGRVPWIPADAADALVLLGRTRIAVIRSGFQLTPVPGSALQASGGSDLMLDAAAHWSIQNDLAAQRALAHTRLTLAALAIGAMRQTCIQSRDYALDRVAFGKPIAHHQSIAFLIADMRMATDAARVLLHEAAWRADRGLPFEAAAAAAFVEAAEAGMFVGPNGVQIFGASGFMRDGPVEKPMRELRTLSLMAGGVDAARSDACAAQASAFLASAEATTTTTTTTTEA